MPERESAGQFADLTPAPHRSEPDADSAAERAEAAERTASHYRDVFGAIDQAFHRCEVITNARGDAVDYRIIEVNPAWTRMTGIEARDAVGRTARALIPTAEAEWIEACGRAGLHRENVRVEQEIAGLRMWYDVHLVPFGAPESRQFVATAADITARKRAEAERERFAAEVAAERERLQRMVLQTPAPLALLDGPEHRFAIVNDAYRRISGGGRDVTGLTPREAFPELVGSGLHRHFDRVFETGEPWDAPETLLRYDRDGNGVIDTWFNLRLEPVRDADGRVVGLFNFAVDVTDQVVARREVEELLAREQRAREDAEAARSDAEAANRAKSQFLAVMSHELRTPLNAIAGYAELMEMEIHGPITDRQRHNLDRIQQSQRHLLGLINEVLKYAKLETGTVHFELRSVRLRLALADAEALVAPQAQAKDLALRLGECPTDLHVRADAEKLRQILVNLLSNAVKFTPTGGRIEVDWSADDDRVRVTVRDTGIGISTDQLQRIFDPFVQVRSELTRSAEGTGLGLAISRDLARGMSGDLKVESTPGDGSAFTLTLPRG